MPNANEEVTMKDVYRSFRQWFSYFLKKWLWFVIAGCLGTAIAVIYIWNKKPSYTAQLSFILSNNSSGGSIYGLASQFGIDLGSNSDAFSGDNINSLMNSKIMVQKALFQKPPGSKEILLNIFSRDMQLNKNWSQSSRTKNSYPFPDSTSKLTYVQDSLFRDIYNNIRNNYLTVSRPDKSLSVYTVETTSNSEIFSLYMTKYLVESTSKLYISTKTSVAKSNLDMLQHEADSIHSLLRGSISSTAKVYDYTYNLNPALQSQRAPAQEGQLNVSAMGTAYGEVLRNLELAKINLQKETPLYQIIDEPQLPLVAEKTSRLLAAIAGVVAGCFLVMIYLVVRRLSQETV